VHKPRLQPLTLILAAFVLLALVEHRVGLLLPLERNLSDLFVRMQARHYEPDPEVVLVNIDDASLARMADLADRWPWPRAVHGELAAGIAAQNPKAIVFDVMFGERDHTRPESDELFNQLIRPLRNVYFATTRLDAAEDPYGVHLPDVAAALGLTAGRDPSPEARVRLLLPLALDPDNWRLGLINLLPDSDGVARRYYLHLPAYGWRIPSLPARVAADLGYEVPQAESILLGWSAQQHKSASFVDLYEDFNREHKERPQDEFTGKIVIVGTNATGLHDLRVTPVSRFHPGADILATAIDNLKNGNAMRTASPGLLLVGGLGTIGLIYLAFRRGYHTIQIGAGVLVSIALLLGWSFMAAGHRSVMPMLTPVTLGAGMYFACALHGYLHERRERLKAVDFFGRFVNPHVVRDLLARGGFPKAGQTRDITILFSDIRGFTTLSERLPPEEVVALLNRYFGRQVEVILRHGGCLDKFIGDAIMAFWGAPLDDPEHAKHAVIAALEMSEQLEAFRRELGSEGAAFDVGIGLNSGPAVVGLMGSENKREYTAVGDTVNLGSRIEGLTKGVARILVSEETMRRCGDAFEFVDRGLHPVKGREKGVRLFEPARKPA
jgi:adenylate cyclase